MHSFAMRELHYLKKKKSEDEKPKTIAEERENRIKMF